MNFFEEQEAARKLTRWLVFWYLMILLVMSVLSSLVLMLLLPVFTHGQIILSLDTSVYALQNWPYFAGISGFIFGGAFISSWLKSRELAKGGIAVAEALNAKLLQSNTRSQLEKRALNVVEEMAIAANIPKPPLYLLSKESQINAFAAGFDTSDAIIGITQGALDNLNREQLQGVIAHEFSHILNGDMRLNLRLIMLLQGIEFIGVLGRFLSPKKRLSSQRRNRKGGGGIFTLVGILLRIIGWVAEVFAKLMQAAISRQREFLADASAVQFTRNPEGIGGALKVLGYDTAFTLKGSNESSSFIHSPGVELYSHLFFATAMRSRLNWFSTHPPLETRILKILPNWDGRFQPAKPQIDADLVQTPSEEALHKGQRYQEEFTQHLMMLFPILFQLPYQEKTQSTPEQMAAVELMKMAQEPYDSMALLVAIFLHKQGFVPAGKEFTIWREEIKSRQAVNAFLMQNQSFEVKTERAIKKIQQVRSVNPLVLIEIALPTLKQLSSSQQTVFYELLECAFQWDKKVSIYESAVFEIIRQNLNPSVRKPSSTEIKNWSAVGLEVQYLLSYMVHHFGYLPDKPLLYQQACHKLQFEVKNLQTLLVIERLDELELPLILHKLKHLSLSKKRDLLKVLVEIVELDQNLSESEEEVVLAIAMSIQAPLPRFSKMSAM